MTILERFKAISCLKLFVCAINPVQAVTARKPYTLHKLYDQIASEAHTVTDRRKKGHKKRAVFTTLILQSSDQK